MAVGFMALRQYVFNSSFSTEWPELIGSSLWLTKCLWTNR